MAQDDDDIQQAIGYPIGSPENPYGAGSRAHGTSLRQLGINPRALGTNPRATRRAGKQKIRQSEVWKAWKLASGQRIRNK